MRLLSTVSWKARSNSLPIQQKQFTVVTWFFFASAFLRCRTGECDIAALESATRQIAHVLHAPKSIVHRSTAPAETGAGMVVKGARRGLHYALFEEQTIGRQREQYENDC